VLSHARQQTSFHPQHDISEARVKGHGPNQSHRPHLGPAAPGAPASAYFSAYFQRVPTNAKLVLTWQFPDLPLANVDQFAEWVTRANPSNRVQVRDDVPVRHEAGPTDHTSVMTLAKRYR